jgi:hypothetical protein
VRALIIILILMKAAALPAQYLDTLQEVFRHKSSFDGRLESRYSLISNELTSVTGFRLGVAFQRKLRLGGGVSWLETNYQKVVYEPGWHGTLGTGVRFLKFGYLCFYADFVFYKNQRWQLSVPIQTGFGLAWYQKKLSYNLMGSDRKAFLFLYEPGITVQFKIFKWFGLGSDVAYRFAMKNNKKITEQISSPTYSFKVLVWFDQLFYQTFPNTKFSKKRGPAVW